MTKLTYYTIPLHITFKAPLMVQGAGALSLGLDCAIQRHLDNNNPVIPGSLIRGNLRHAWKAFSKINESEFSKQNIDAFLGNDDAKGKDGYQRDGNAARLNFDYWWTTKCEETPSAMRYRVEIDTTTGASKRGSLQVVENPWPIGTLVTFSGKICAWLSSEEKEQLLTWLPKGITWAHQMGAFKGVGFGEIASVALGTVEDNKATPLTCPADDPDRFGVRLAFDRPICIARPNVGDNNHFSSNHIVPGAAIIATIISQAKALGYDVTQDLCGINELVVSHAHPIDKGEDTQLPLATPLSLAEVDPLTEKKGENKEQIILDMACNPWDPTSQSLNFSSDWKPNTANKVSNLLGQCYPHKRLEVRTRIDAETLAAEEGKLFSMETCATHQHEWVAKIDLGRVANDKKQALKEKLLEILSWGLHPIGKTKAHATVKIVPYPTYIAHQDFPPEALSVSPTKTHQIYIYLQTDARLLLNSFVQGQQTQAADLRNAYDTVWKGWSNNMLTLNDFFAQQKLAGGDFLWHRFGNNPRENYYPELLTTAGSVFVLNYAENDTDEVHLLLQQWQRFGLPQPEQSLLDSQDHKITHWQNNPWLATNGFGAIAINIQFPNGQTKQAKGVEK